MQTVRFISTLTVMALGILPLSKLYADLKPGTYRLPKSIAMEILEGTQVIGSMDIPVGRNIVFVKIVGDTWLVQLDKTEGYIPVQVVNALLTVNQEMASKPGSESSKEYPTAPPRAEPLDMATITREAFYDGFIDSAALVARQMDAQKKGTTFRTNATPVQLAQARLQSYLAKRLDNGKPYLANISEAGLKEIWTREYIGGFNEARSTQNGEKSTTHALPNLPATPSRPGQERRTAMDTISNDGYYWGIMFAGQIFLPKWVDDSSYKPSANEMQKSAESIYPRYLKKHEPASVSAAVYGFISPTDAIAERTWVMGYEKGVLKAIAGL